MTQNLTHAPGVNRTPAGLILPTYGQVDLPLVDPVVGQPVSLTLDPGQSLNLTADPGQPVNPTPVNSTAPVNSTSPDPDPAAPTLTEPPADAPAGQVNGSAGQADPLTVKPRRRWGIFRRRPRPAEPTPAPTAAPAAEAKRQPVPVPWWLGLIFHAVMWTVTVVSTMFVAGGQVKAAENVGIRDERKYLVPVGLEAIAVALFLMGYIAGRLKISPWLFWIPAFGVGGFAVHNVYLHSDNPGQGMLIGGIAAAALILWWAHLFMSLITYRRQINFTPGGGIRFGRLWLDDPRLTFWAGRIARRWELTERQDALKYSETFVAVLNEAKAAHKNAKRDKSNAEATLRSQHLSESTREKAEQQLAEARDALMPRALRLRTAWRTVQEAAGRPVAQLPSTASVDRIRLVRKQAPPPADAAPAAPPAADEVDEATVEPEDAVEAWTEDINQQPTPRKRRPANAPTSPAPAGAGKDPYVHHRAAITWAIDRIKDWKTRENPVTWTDVRDTKPLDAKGKVITGKGTLLDIRWLIEMMSDRADQVPDAIWTKYGVSREGRAAK